MFALSDTLSVSGPPLLYAAIFALALIETLPFAGMLFPGTITLTVSGAAVFLFSGNLPLALLSGILGAITSDTIGYELGLRRPTLFHRKSLREHIVRVQGFLKKRPSTAVYLSEFRSNLRSLLPFVAGMKKVKRWHYYPQAIVSSALRLILCIGGGYTIVLILRTSFLWIARKESFLLAMVLLLLLFAALWRWSIRRGRRALTILASLIWNASGQLMRHPLVSAWLDDHEWIRRDVRRALSVRSFFGLRFTAICIVMLYAVVQLWEVIANYLHGGVLLTIDTNVANLLFAFRTPLLINAFYAITLLGSEWMVIGLATIFTVAFWIRRRQALVFALWTNLALTTIAVWYLKLFFARARPDIVHAAYREYTYSFPSAHSAYAMALYGFIAYTALRSLRISWRRKMTIVFGCAMIDLLVSFSRLYLGVHYFSDVLGGALIGLIVLLGAVSIGEWLMVHFHRTEQTISPRTFTIMTVMSAFLAISLILTSNFPSPSILSTDAPDVRTGTGNLLSAFDDGGLSRFTESLTGARQEPVSLLIVSPSDACLRERFSAAGWIGSDPVSPMSLYYAFRATVLNDPYPTAPMTPAFFAGEPHDIGLQKPTDRRSVRARHHARIWRTHFVTPLGRIYVGTASLDTNIKWGGWKLGITHAIDAKIDRERDLIALELLQTDGVERADIVPFVSPMIGRNFTGDLFETDGKIALLVLKQCRDVNVQAQVIVGPQLQVNQ